MFQIVYAVPNEDKSWWELAVTRSWQVAVFDAFQTQSCIFLKSKHSWNTHSFTILVRSLKWQFMTANFYLYAFVNHIIFVWKEIWDYKFCEEKFLLII